MNPIRFGSIASGIEAASVAFAPLGWQAAWLSEIAPFPCAVLAHHYPDTPNLGDMRGIVAKLHRGEAEAPDILVGGTPCQAFSFAGLGGGLADERGALTMEFARIADAVDAIRAGRNKPKAVIGWENVPGVFSTDDNAFGCFLGALAGAGCALRPAGVSNHEKPVWPRAGVVVGPARAVAWRTLDAQYFGLAQQRERVFVVASARNDICVAAILFESEGVRRDLAPCRADWEAAATAAAPGAGAGGDAAADGGCWWDGGQLSQTLDAVLEKRQTMPERGRFPAVLQPIAFPAFMGATACASSAELSPALGAKNPTAVTRGKRARRLTPRECERLQGFPDDYTLVPYRGKPASDNPRYTAIGNSWPIPVARWIGQRIDAALQRAAVNAPTARPAAERRAKAAAYTAVGDIFGGSS